MELHLSCYMYLVLLSIDSKSRYCNKTATVLWPDPYEMVSHGNCRCKLSFKVCYSQLVAPCYGCCVHNGPVCGSSPSGCPTPGTENDTRTDSPKIWTRVCCDLFCHGWWWLGLWESWGGEGIRRWGWAWGWGEDEERMRMEMKVGQVIELRLSCHLVLLSIDSKTR